MTRHLATAFLSLGALAAAGCHGTPVEELQTTAAPVVKVVTLAPRTVEGIVTASGLVAAAPGADWIITAPEAARIVEMPKGEGESVRPGDLLVRYEIPTLATDVAARHAEVEQAQARVENTKASVDRLTTLVEHGVAAQKELEDARRESTEARASLAQAQSASQGAAVLQGRSVVRARFAGVVARRAHNPGDLVEPTAADVILRVVDPSRLQVIASVAAGDVARIEAGRAVRIMVPGTTQIETGKVLTRPAAVDPAGGTGEVRIAFGAPTRLPIGTPLRVEIVAETRLQALAVPAGAVLHEGDEAFVMVAGTDNQAHKRRVDLGLATPRDVEVTGGLKAGEQVIVQGHQGLPDGAAITITP